MTMTEMSAFVFAWFAGVCLGLAFFAGLWWSLRKALSSRRAARWHFASLIVRVTFTLTGFYLVGDGDWQRLALCLTGFVMARAVAIRWTRETGHAPQP